MTNFKQKLGRILGLGMLSLLPSLPLLAAETITFSVWPAGEFNRSLKSLENFAKTGKINSDLVLFTKKFFPEDLVQIRHVLNESLPINEVEAFRFFNTAFGQELIKQFSQLLKSPPDQSQPLLEGAIISAAADPDGLNIINVLKNYDSPTLALNLETVRNSIDEADQLYQATERIFNWLDRQAAAEAIPLPSSINLSNLASKGNQTWTSETLRIPRPNRDPLTVFVYLPEKSSQPAPLIVIAPGLNSDFQSLSYVAQHLASYGFAIVGINFPESDAKRLYDALHGLDTLPTPNAWMEQPKDVSLVLDTLEQKMQSYPNWQGKIDTQNTGILGQSLGGYTAIATGGANIEWDYLLKECAKLNDVNQINLNPALLWQCQGINAAAPLRDLQDSRIKAVIAVNPVTNPVFGNQGIDKISVPIMFIAGSSDIFAPSLSQQIFPFSDLNKKDKYLLLVKNGTHLSFLTGVEGLPEFIIGKGQNLADDYLKSISLAFFNFYLNQQAEFESYLTDEAVQKMGKQPLALHLIRSLTQEQLEQALKQHLNTGLE
ncbi:MAG: alpha/beta hydrolase [Microcystis wesenbergii Mw_MB_S_20031200_S109]|uniref:Alpha/beta hydrolase n=1 Tax=Microcystis wesenbergii Mw_MB_S_20031200_S109D TaxID=2486241 RepID=A0A552LZN5_9CHRO|nr:MAG: alpha/beta hydrolase [Microcystis wesenbergii Mw_MB_S_20031200_S109]TRV25674.1 MAG: alpha/beta hydrolase [Microcystis wesenbergii Mw_MB_S_20031200_S109D]